MKFWKHSLVAAAAFFCISSIVLYSSCTVDSCQTLLCRNGGTCADGFCRCPSGYEGTQCETLSAVKFYGRYYGITQCDGDPVIIDSAIIDRANVDTSNRGIQVGIFSRGVENRIYGNVIGNEVQVVPVEGKEITIEWIGEDKVEVLIEETVDGQKQICNFSGTKG